MARYSTAHKRETGRRLSRAAERCFREQGFGGSGVSGLAEAAGATTGAFYKHFASKDEAFAAVVKTGMIELAEGIERFQSDHGDAWASRFIKWYLSPQRRDDIASSCILPGLTADVVRADPAARRAYTEGLERAVAAVARGLPGEDPEGRSRAVLALLSGAVSLARAVDDPAIAASIAKGARRAAEALVRT